MLNKNIGEMVFDELHFILNDDSSNRFNAFIQLLTQLNQIEDSKTKFNIPKSIEELRTNWHIYNYKLAQLEEFESRLTIFSDFLEKLPDTYTIDPIYFAKLWDRMEFLKYPTESLSAEAVDLSNYIKRADLGEIILAYMITSNRKTES